MEEVAVDKLYIQHKCGGETSVFSMLVRYGVEELTDVQCSGCGRVMRFQALILPAEEG